MSNVEDKIIVEDLERRINFLNNLLPLFEPKEDDTEEVKQCSDYYIKGLEDITKFLEHMKSTVNLNTSGVILF
jgi:hypothetical protein